MIIRSKTVIINWIGAAALLLLSMTTEAKIFEHGALVSQREFGLQTSAFKTIPDPDHGTFTKNLDRIKKMGVAVYRVGDKYQVLVPHSIIFHAYSSNLLPKAKQHIAALHAFLRAYETEKISYTAMYIDNKDQGRWLSKSGVAKKQAAVLLRNLQSIAPLASIQLVNSVAMNVDESLPFWYTSRQIVASKRMLQNATLLEFQVATS